MLGFDGEPERRQALAIWRVGEDNTKMNPKDMVFEDVDLIHLACDRDKWRNVMKRHRAIWKHTIRGISWLTVYRLLRNTEHVAERFRSLAHGNHYVSGYRPFIYIERSSVSQDIRSPVRITGRTSDYVLYTGRRLCLWYNLKREWTIPRVLAHVLFNTGWQPHIQNVIKMRGGVQRKMCHSEQKEKWEGKLK